MSNFGVKTLVLCAALGFAVAGIAPVANSDGEKPERTPDGLLRVGAVAPDFSLAGTDGKSIRLREFRGHPVVLYFYPKDDTPGCTKEACSFRDDFGRFDSLGIRVLGVSTDGLRSHRGFARKYSLPFHLLADTAGTVVRLYGVGVELNQGGTTRWIANRVTYLIDAQGVIRRVWPKVTPIEHGAEVIEACLEIAARSSKN